MISKKGYLLIGIISVFVVVLALSSTVPKQPNVNEPPSPNRFNQETKGDLVEVTKVVDGDTIDVKLADGVERLRLIGMDTPETVDPRKTVQCFGIEASNKAKELLQGKKVSLESDPSQGERDKYDRLLRYAFLPDGRNYNLLMIREGYAHEYTYQSVPYKYQSEFRAAENQAREAKAGLWADNTCSGNTNSGSLTTQTPQSSGEDKDCVDFNSQAEAQAYFESKGGSPSKNVDRLDADHDGVACENL